MSTAADLRRELSGHLGFHALGQFLVMLLCTYHASSSVSLCPSFPFVHLFSEHLLGFLFISASGLKTSLSFSVLDPIIKSSPPAPTACSLSSARAGRLDVPYHDYTKFTEEGPYVHSLMRHKTTEKRLQL